MKLRRHIVLAWCCVVVFVVPRPVQKALESDDDLDTLADPCGNGELGDEITERFPPRPVMPTSSPASTTTTTTAEFIHQFTHHWQNRDYGPSPDVWYPFGVVPTTRMDSVLRRRPALSSTSTTPRQLTTIFYTAALLGLLLRLEQSAVCWK